MIKVSDKARSKVIELMTEDGFDPVTDYIRVGVKSGGCSGLSYDLRFDKSQEDGDKLFEDNGVRIIVDKKVFST
jgi:iron-sulfur cluster assembly protein